METALRYPRHRYAAKTALIVSCQRSPRRLSITDRSPTRETKFIGPGLNFLQRAGRPRKPGAKNKKRKYVMRHLILTTAAILLIAGAATSGASAAKHHHHTAAPSDASEQLPPTRWMLTPHAPRICVMPGIIPRTTWMPTATSGRTDFATREETGIVPGFFPPFSGMIFSKNRFTLFRITPTARRQNSTRHWPGPTCNAARPATGTAAARGRWRIAAPRPSAR